MPGPAQTIPLRLEGGDLRRGVFKVQLPSDMVGSSGDTN